MVPQNRYQIYMFLDLTQINLMVLIYIEFLDLIN